MKKKWLTAAILAAVTNLSLSGMAGAEALENHQMNEMVVEGASVQEALPGGYVAAENRVGILGDVEVIDVPFTERKYTEKMLENFSDPAQPMNGVLANNPSIRVGSPSPMYTDFTMRGVNMNATQYYINGVPNMFNQTRSMPMYVLESLDIVSGPNTVLNGATFSNNGVNGYDAPVGMINGTTKRATDTPITRYTQTFSGGSVYTENLDVGRRFGKDNQWGVRVNVRNENGGLAIHNAEVDDKTFYINVDHKDAKSKTNIFGGYFDWKVDGGQRWLAASSLKNLVSAPSGKNDLSFAGQTKQNHGWLMTINHDQKLDDRWSVFYNFGANYYQEFKQDPQSGSWTLNNDGTLTGNHRNYRSESRGIYNQMGFMHESEAGAAKNKLSVAYDYFNYRSHATNIKGAAITGDIWSGVTLLDMSASAPSLDTKAYTREHAHAITVADRVEIGKHNIYLAAQYRDYTYNDPSTVSINRHSVNPTFAYAYKPTDKVSLYGSFAQSFTRPLVVGNTYDNYGEVFAPVKNKQFEIGAKYENAKLLHSVALYEIEQGQYIDEPSSGPQGKVRSQEGQNKYKGFEYAVTGQLTDKWSLTGGFAYINGKQEKCTDKTLEGMASFGAPKWNAVLSAEYEMDKKTSLLGRVLYTGKSLINKNGVKTPQYFVFDLGIKHKTQISKVPVTLSAMCYNVFDKHYWINRGTTSVALGAPRTFMLSAAFDL